MNPLQKYNDIPPFVEVGYEPKTTFWGDFGVAEIFEPLEMGSIKDTYERSFNEYKDDKEYGTELAMVLNWKAWEHHAKGNDELTRLYAELFSELDQYIMDNWQGDDLSYYLKTTD